MFSWFKYLSVNLVFFPPLGLWSGNFLLTAPFPDHYLLVPFSWCLPGQTISESKTTIEPDSLNNFEVLHLCRCNLDRLL